MTETTSLEKGLRILREVAACDGGVTLAELARATGLNRTTTYRLCDVLEAAGWLQRVGRQLSAETRTVGAGPRLFGMSVLIANNYDPEARLRPAIDRLAQTLTETVHVGVLEGNEVVHVARALPSSGLNMAARIGEREFAHLTALGKALLAALPRDGVLRAYPDEVLPGRAKNSIRHRQELLAELDRTAARGYAVDDEESRAGVKCVSVPIFDSSGNALFAISLTTVPARLKRHAMREAVDAVRAAAGSATASFGGLVPPWWGPNEDAIDVEPVIGRGAAVEEAHEE